MISATSSRTKQGKSQAGYNERLHAIRESVHHDLLALDALLLPYFDLPNPVRTREREVGGSLVFSLMTTPQDVMTSANGGMEDIMTNTGSKSKDDYAILGISSPDMAETVPVLLPRTAVEPCAPLSTHLGTLLTRVIFRAASQDYSTSKRPGAPLDCTKPNSLLFTDIVLWRRINEALVLLRELYPEIHSDFDMANLDLKTGCFDINQMRFSSKNGGSLMHARKIALAICAERSCGLFGPHKYRCGRCMVAYYCSPDHQDQDWKSMHKQECRSLAVAQMAFNEMWHEVRCGCKSPICQSAAFLESHIDLQFEKAAKPVKEREVSAAKPGTLVTFDMKREMAEKIQEFDGPTLDRVVEIIRNSAPALLGNDDKEIELDIDMLDQRTLLKLYEFVIHPVGKGKKLKPKKKKVKGRKRGVDEVVEEEGINVLQAQLAAL